MNNAEFNTAFCERTKAYAKKVVDFVDKLPFNTVTKVLGEQLLKSSTSIGANFRAFCRGRSRNEKFSKICIVVEESDEVLYWLDLFTSTKYADHPVFEFLFDEGTQILKISSSIKNGLYPK